MEQKIYKMVTGWYIHDFNLKVSGHLSEGWELYESPLFNPYNGYLCQALTKTIEVTEH